MRNCCNVCEGISDNDKHCSYEKEKRENKKVNC